MNEFHIIFLTVHSLIYYLEKREIQIKNLLQNFSAGFLENDYYYM